MASTLASRNLKAQRPMRLCDMCFSLIDLNCQCCRMCGRKLNVNSNNPSQSMQITIAMLITSIILYVPANLLPIMYTTYLGEQSPNTIMGGVITLWEQGSYPIAFIIFVASVLVPIAKIMTLSWLCYICLNNKVTYAKSNLTMYRLTEFIGRWSMIDIFVVAVLVSLIQLGNIMNVRAGEATLPFMALVVTTMFAALSFDSKWIWESKNNKHDRK